MTFGNSIIVIMGINVMIVFPILCRLLTLRVFDGLGGQTLLVPVRRQERPVIRLGNAHETVDAVRDEKPIGDPASYGAARNVQTICKYTNRNYQIASCFVAPMQ